MYIWLLTFCFPCRIFIFYTKSLPLDVVSRVCMVIVLQRWRCLSVQNSSRSVAKQSILSYAHCFLALNTHTLSPSLLGILRMHQSHTLVELGSIEEIGPSLSRLFMVDSNTLIKHIEAIFVSDKKFKQLPGCCT